MKKILTFLAAAVSAAMVFSCEELPQTNLPTATLSADQAFVDGKANITVTLSSAAPVDVTATIAYGSAREGKMAIELSALKFDETVVLRAGEKVASCTVELVSTENIPDGAEAPIALAAVSADDYGQLKCDVAIAYITYNANTYNGDNGGNSGEPNNPGVDTKLTFVKEWSVALVGEPNVDEYGPYQEVSVNLPGIKYFYPFTLNDEFIADCGGLDALASFYESSIKEELAESQISELLYSLADEVVFVDHPGEAGVYDIYILEFNNDGSLSGRYGKSTVTFTEIEGYNPGDDEDDDDDDDPEFIDVIAVNGTGDADFTFGLFEKGSITQENLEESMIALGTEIYKAYLIYSALFEMMGYDVELSVADFLNNAEYNTAEFYAVDNGEYDVLIVGVNESGNLTGQYNVSTITVDGHDYAGLAELESRLKKAMIQKAVDSKKLIRSKKSATPARKKVFFAPEDDTTGAEDDEEEINITIDGALTVMSAWQAEYLGRYEYTQPDDPDDPDYPEEEEYPFEGTLQLQSNWSVKLDGEPYYYDDSYPIIDVVVNLPGIQYYWLEDNTQDDLDRWYGGSVEGIASAWQTNYINDIKSGYYTIEEMLWYDKDPATYIDIYNVGATTIYVLEFDKDGYATGRYGASQVVIPELPDYEGEDEGGYFADKKSVRVKVRVKHTR